MNRLILENGARWRDLDTGKIVDPQNLEAAAAPPRQAVLQLFGSLLADGESGSGYTAAAVVAALDGIRPGSVDEIIFKIDSSGGDVAGCKRIIEAMEKRKEKFTGLVVGQCYSAAFLVFMTCHERRAIVDSTLMMHAAHSAGCIEATRTETEWSTSHIAKRLPHLSKSTIKTWCDAHAGRGVYFGAVQAEKLGIVHRWVLGDLRSYRPVADNERPFHHEGGYAPSACQCADCRAKRGSAAAPRAGHEPISIPPLPESLQLVHGCCLMRRGSVGAHAVASQSPAEQEKGAKALRKMLFDHQRQQMARAKARAMSKAEP